MPSSPSISRFWNFIFIFKHLNVFLFNVRNKILCFFERLVIYFLDESSWRGYSKVRGLIALDFFFFFLSGARCKGVRSIFQSGADTLEEIMISTTGKR